MVERERMESMTRASLNGYAVTARIEYGHGRSPLPYRRLHGLVRFAKLLRPCPHYSNLEFDAGLEWAEPNTALTRFRTFGTPQHQTRMKRNSIRAQQGQRPRLSE